MNKIFNLKNYKSQEMGRQLIGFAALAPGSRSVDVQLEEAVSSIDYVVHVELPYQTSYWITNKTKFGFRINFGVVCSGYHQKIGWSVGIHF